jgi:dipeptidyl aminopeptidase/acylaminoacyl peptidase
VGPADLSCASAIPTGHQLALVTLRGVPGIAVRDVTDVAHPVTRCTFNGGTYFRFRDETHVSYIATASPPRLGAPGSLYLADLQTGTTSLIRSWSYGGDMSWVYSWSPDGQALTFLTSDESGVQWHVLSASGDRTLSNLGTVPARGADPDIDDAMVGFSADGQYVAVVETHTSGPTPPFQVVRVSNGSLVYSRIDGAMAVWLGSGAKLYFRTATDVRFWDPTVVQTIFILGLGPKSWIHPSASADGNRIVFTGADPQGNHNPSVVEVPGGPGPLVSGRRVGAAFLTSTLAWWAGEGPCATPCGMGGPPLSGETWIYDFGTHSEALSIIAALYDSWPHVVGQS